MKWNNQYYCCCYRGGIFEPCQSMFRVQRSRVHLQIVRFWVSVSKTEKRRIGNATRKLGSVVGTRFRFVLTNELYPWCSVLERSNQVITFYLFLSWVMIINRQQVHLFFRFSNCFVSIKLWFNFHQLKFSFCFRSAKVNLKCGSTNQLTAVSEPSRCEYEFIFETPTACKKFVPQSPEHDEL